MNSIAVDPRNQSSACENILFSGEREFYMNHPSDHAFHHWFDKEESRQEKKYSTLRIMIINP